MTVDPIIYNLDAFWPSIQCLYGKNLDDAEQTLKGKHSIFILSYLLSNIAFHATWQKWKFLPERYDILREEPYGLDTRYLLRPELVESILYVYKKTANPLWLYLAMDVVESIELYCKTKCGYAAIEVKSLNKMDNMESFFLSETLKYLFLHYTPNHHLFQKDFILSTGKPSS